jgi:hypothetical protein
VEPAAWKRELQPLLAGNATHVGEKTAVHQPQEGAGRNPGP